MEVSHPLFFFFFLTINTGNVSNRELTNETKDHNDTVVIENML